VRTQARSPFLSTAIGRVETKLGQYDKAVGDLQEALSQAPDYVPAHYWLGEAHQRRGEKRQALEKWSAALKYDPKYLRASRALLENG
jgi:tetratricopeptide (TPR) repeat protein